MPSIQEIYDRNMRYAKPASTYITKLAPQEEMAFHDWVVKNKVPFDDSPVADYDMRGFYRGLMNGDPHAGTGVNANDGQLHFSDYWKTPFHQSFSAESQYANPELAPKWNEKDQLVLPDGTVVFDERAQQRRK